MADKRISQLDAITEPIVGSDLLVLVDVSADSGTGKTHKLRLDEFLPAGGTTEQHLVKASGDDYDFKYQHPQIFGMAQVNYQLPIGSTSVNFVANTYTVIPFNTSIVNTISGLTVDSGGVISLPIGTFLINSMCSPYYTHRGAMYIKDETNNVFLAHGVMDFSTGATTYALHLTHTVVVSTPTDFSVGAIKGRTERIGLPVSPYISGEPTLDEVFATLTIQKVG